jgi:phosphoribosyl 1,2-cyclic phosphate phosphodiesterase
MEIEILGSGTSMGVPMVGCECRVCRSEDPRDKRTRTSVFIRKNDVEILIDTSADYRQQMLRAGIKNLDAVIYTHYHVDHILGMDDLRSLNIINKKSIPIYASEDTFRRIKQTFAYAFADQAFVSSVPRIVPHIINAAPFFIQDLEITPIPLLHGELPVFGFRIGDFAYCTDVSEIPAASYPLLGNLDVLILGALRYKSHPTHFTIEEAVKEAGKIHARKTYLTHLSHGVLHAEAESGLPGNIRLAYDGLRLTVD